jgi:hypothetical protein
MRLIRLVGNPYPPRAFVVLQQRTWKQSLRLAAPPLSSRPILKIEFTDKCRDRIEIDRWR